MQTIVSESNNGRQEAVCHKPRSVLQHSIIGRHRRYSVPHSRGERSRKSEGRSLCWLPPRKSHSRGTLASQRSHPGLNNREEMAEQVYPPATGYWLRSAVEHTLATLAQARTEPSSVHVGFGQILVLLWSLQAASNTKQNVALHTGAHVTAPNTAPLLSLAAQRP